MPYLLRREVLSAEVDPVDHRVDRRNRVAACPDDGGVVTEAAHEPRIAGAEELIEPVDQLELAQPGRA